MHSFCYIRDTEYMQIIFNKLCIYFKACKIMLMYLSIFEKSDNIINTNGIKIIE